MPRPLPALPACPGRCSVGGGPGPGLQAIATVAGRQRPEPRHLWPSASGPVWNPGPARADEVATRQGFGAIDKSASAPPPPLSGSSNPRRLRVSSWARDRHLIDTRGHSGPGPLRPRARAGWPSPSHHDRDGCVRGSGQADCRPSPERVNE